MIQRTQIASLKLFGPLFDCVVVVLTYLLAMGVRDSFRKVVALRFDSR